ncbi:hypothetical protein AU210_016436 [Fusarium oxysporum f. sp. radicis-cucumerinum]|uniref:Uncharacterized protein n=1 Tax=Fusarium oxysporum f. sp. radicis-cucumerinum TaxID=327505 RepID=A0A2H3G302_FUSOX|nr:hypothetical protein AU210_016436 [Fusarium oxysporum f. sp. radicis-cucumerinum]
MWQVYELLTRARQWNSGSSSINSLLASTIFDSAGAILQSMMTGLKDQQRNISSDELASKISEFFSGPGNDVHGSGKVSPLALGLLTLALVWWISLAQMARRVILSLALYFLGRIGIANFILSKQQARLVAFLIFFVGPQILNCMILVVVIAYAIKQGLKPEVPQPQ